MTHEGENAASVRSNGNPPYWHIEMCITNVVLCLSNSLIGIYQYKLLNYRTKKNQVH